MSSLFKANQLTPNLMFFSTNYLILYRSITPINYPQRMLNWDFSGSIAKQVGNFLELRDRRDFSSTLQTVVNSQVQSLIVSESISDFPEIMTFFFLGSSLSRQFESCRKTAVILTAATTALQPGILLMTKRSTFKFYHSFTPQILRNIRKGRVILFYLDFIITLKYLP